MAVPLAGLEPEAVHLRLSRQLRPAQPVQHRITVTTWASVLTRLRLVRSLNTSPAPLLLAPSIPWIFTLQTRLTALLTPLMIWTLAMLKTAAARMPPVYLWFSRTSIPTAG